MIHHFRTLLIVFMLCLGDLAFACHCSRYFVGVKSLAELESYDFIALVKVTSEQTNPPKSDFRGETGLLKIEILEQFKGNKVSEAIEQSKNSSCDLGIEVGDEWILFGKLSDGKPVLSACDRNARYRDKNGTRDWHFSTGIRELNDLRRLYRHDSQPIPDGILRLSYPNGALEVEETYSNGLKNGPRKILYSDGSLWGKESYLNDSLQGESSWYYPSGQLYHHQFFQNGKPFNVTRVYYDTTIDASMKKFMIKNFYKTEDSMRLEYSRVQVQFETIYDHLGREILFRQYSRQGKLTQEDIYQQERNFGTHISYYNNGQIQSIEYSLNHESYGHYQEYDADGNPTKSWDYDQSGRQILKK